MKRCKGRAQVKQTVKQLSIRGPRRSSANGVLLTRPHWQKTREHRRTKRVPRPNWTTNKTELELLSSAALTRQSMALGGHCSCRDARGNKGNCINKEHLIIARNNAFDDIPRYRLTDQIYNTKRWFIILLGMGILHLIASNLQTSSTESYRVEPLPF